MTCYFRHLKVVFEKAGIEVTAENKRDIDKITHDIVNVKYKNSSAIWKEVKMKITENENDFVAKLKETWKKG